MRFQRMSVKVTLSAFLKKKKCMFLFKMKIYLLDIYLLTIKLDLIFLTYGDTHLDIIHTKHCHNCALTNY